MNKPIQSTTAIAIGLLASSSALQAATVVLNQNTQLAGQTGVGELVMANNGGPTNQNNNNATGIQVRNGYSLTIETGAIVNSNGALNISQGQAGSGANVTQQAGSTLNLGTSLSMSGNGTGGTSFFTTSGTLDIGNNLNAGLEFTSTFTVAGDTAAITVGGNVNAEANSIFAFNLAAAGVSEIDAAGAFNLTSGAALNVNGSSYTGGAGTINLFSYASAGSATEFAENVSGFTNFTTDVVYTGTGVDLVLTAIPEPSSALLASLGAAGMLLRRRR